jgi:protein-L-isoaspartate(D-aspartate) O-methyltransferase
MSDFSSARKHMVDSQIHTAGVIDPAILEAFEAVPREKFVPKNLKAIAYIDEDLAISGQQGLLAPVTHARMIQALKPAATDVVLDIGGTTGYSAALFSRFVQTVIALEEQEPLLKQANAVWQELGACNVVGIQGQLTRGCPKYAPFNIIFMNGCATEVPNALADQLADGGRMALIVKKPGQVMGQVTLVRKTGNNISAHVLFEAGGLYLPGFEPIPSFTF